jgi:hypothetical protein
MLRVNDFSSVSLLPGLFLGILLVFPMDRVRAADAGAPASPAFAAMPARTMAEALPPEKWRQLENSVDRGLAWIASQQAPDGSFSTLAVGQPGVTSLCVMAFLSRGHRPGFGPYGQQLNRAVDFVLSCQKEDGLLSDEIPQPDFVLMGASHTAGYNHSISGLMLGEVYGHVTGQRAKNVRAAIGKAIKFSRALQTRPKAWGSDAGGVRYVRQKPGETDSDLSTTVWHLMFFRSAKNAEFNVPQEYVDETIAYVRRCWDPRQNMFSYSVDGNGGFGASRGMVGAGIVSLSMAGQHNTPIALAAGDWLLTHPFGSFNEAIGPWDRYFYSTYYCSQAAAQLGGHYWEKIFPPIVEVFLKIQTDNGAFPPEPQQKDAMFGSTYSTAMAVLALTPAYQLLPVYQR